MSGIRPRAFHYHWRWRLEASPEALWPLVADTSRFNRDAGLPPVEQGEAGANRRRRLGFRRLGVPIAWEEEPFEWLEPERFSVVRRYARGPVAEMRVAAELHPLDDGGTRLDYRVWAWPRDVLGLAAIPAQIGVLSARRFEAVMRRYDQLAARPTSAVQLATRPVTLPAGGAARLAAARAELVGQGLEPALVARLVDAVAHGDELALGRLRPYALAREWNADRRAVLELFLHATRAGLLELRWDLLCPRCGGARASSAHLRDVEPEVHCDSCGIDVKAGLEHNVELAFRPCPAVRSVAFRAFCVGGPRVTPHVVAQQLVPAGAERSLRASLGPGRYRLRLHSSPRAQSVLVRADGAGETVVEAGPAGLRGREVVLAPTSVLHVRNASGSEQLVLLERAAWSDDVVTAAEVTALQLFRDLFAAEALRPSEPIAVGTLTVLFTDLRDSTRFYREVGDAPAFGSVMAHMDVLRDAVADEGGAVVKAMGDAIMAVFTRPAPALRAALRAQRAVAVPGPGRPALQLKVGVHAGPCIAVTQNGVLDYFGSTVNLAARLVALSSGDDVVVSGAVAADPEVAGELAAGKLGEAVPLQAALKGFEEAPPAVWRLGSPAHAAVAPH